MTNQFTKSTKKALSKVMVGIIDTQVRREFAKLTAGCLQDFDVVDETIREVVENVAHFAGLYQGDKHFQTICEAVTHRADLHVDFLRLTDELGTAGVEFEAEGGVIEILDVFDFKAARICAEFGFFRVAGSKTFVQRGF
jgi:uncharacterized protein YpuA (DUF1002 family)